MNRVIGKGGQATDTKEDMLINRTIIALKKF